MIKIQKTYQNKIATLFLVATPIGNLKEMTERAVLILKNEVNVIFCEDKRISQKLLNFWNIKTKLYTLHKFNENQQQNKILEYLKNNQNVAIISCAGVPLIADPGYVVVKKVLENDFYVTAVGINSALLNGLICSGLPTNQFIFSNFLNPKITQKKKQLEILLASENTIIAYESVHKLKKTIELLKIIAPDRFFCLAKELTKFFETFYRGLIKEFDFENFPLRGEFVLILEGNKSKKENNLNEFFDKIKTFNLTNKEIISLGMNFGYRKNDLYRKLNLDKSNHFDSQNNNENE